MSYRGKSLIVKVKKYQIRAQVTQAILQVNICGH